MSKHFKKAPNMIPTTNAPEALQEAEASEVPEVLPGTVEAAVEAPSASAEPVAVSEPPAPPIPAPVAPSAVTGDPILTGKDPIYRKHIFGKFEKDRAPVEIEVTLARAINGQEKILKNVAIILAEYRRDNGTNIASNKETMNDQTSRLWTGIRMAVTDKETMRQSLDLIVAVFRENRNKAFSLNMVLRYVGSPGSSVIDVQATSFTNLVTVFNRASELNRKRDITRSIDLERCFRETIFSEEQYKKVIGWLTQD